MFLDVDSGPKYATTDINESAQAASFSLRTDQIINLKHIYKYNKTFKYGKQSKISIIWYVRGLRVQSVCFDTAN